jgi:hypothetical protein
MIVTLIALVFAMIGTGIADHGAPMLVVAHSDTARTQLIECSWQAEATAPVLASALSGYPLYARITRQWNPRAGRCVDADAIATPESSTRSAH